MTDTDEPLPRDFVLYQNHPNPFNDATTISYTLLRESDVSITIYNTLGQRIRLLNRGPERIGNHAISWDGKDAEGRQIASGLYYYRLKTAFGSDYKKMLMIK